MFSPRLAQVDRPAGVHDAGDQHEPGEARRAEALRKAVEYAKLLAEDRLRARHAPDVLPAAAGVPLHDAVHEDELDVIEERRARRRVHVVLFLWCVRRFEGASLGEQLLHAGRAWGLDVLRRGF